MPRARRGDTVSREIAHAVLAGHHRVFLGGRRQGKTRSIRQLTTLLDLAIAVVAGCTVNDDRFRPSCAACCRHRVQVGLSTLMEEQNGQSKGSNIRLPRDVVIVASARPDATGRRRSGTCRHAPRQQRGATSGG